MMMVMVSNQTITIIWLAKQRGARSTPSNGQTISLNLDEVIIIVGVLVDITTNPAYYCCSLRLNILCRFLLLIVYHSGCATKFYFADDNGKLSTGCCCCCVAVSI